MKRAILALSLLWLTAIAQEPRVPRQAEDIGIQTGPEKYLWLSQYRGKTCVLAFILTTCPHCQFTTGILNRIQNDYKNRDVQVMASAIEPMSSLNIPDFQKKFLPAFPVGYNDQSYVAKFLGRGPSDPMMVPQLAFVDRNGVIRAQFAGDDPALANNIQEKSLRDALDRTIKEGQTALAPARK
ncbi:MAG TPA: TlpA disulfide reductase family protein [Bryobacteraceae bacterium]|nr:TlpA disulfide reductase family protein [Bryobacteraceae bacterium]